MRRTQLQMEIFKLKDYTNLAADEDISMPIRKDFKDKAKVTLNIINALINESCN